MAAIGRGREKQVEFWVPQRQKAFDHQRPGHRPHLVDTFAARRPRAGQNELSHQVRCFQRDVLRHKSAERKAEQIDLLEAERADQGNRIPRHFIDRHRRCSARRTDTPVIGRDHAMLAGEAVDNPRIEIVENRTPMVEKN